MSIYKHSLKSRRCHWLLIALIAYGCLAPQLMAQDITPINDIAPINNAAKMTEAEQALDAVFMRGKKLFSRCDRCHTVGSGEGDGLGPNLYGIFGAKAGLSSEFEYSEPMLNSGIIWDETSMDALIRKPKKLVPKTSMVFFGMRKEADRDALIHYLKHVTQ